MCLKLIFSVVPSFSNMQVDCIALMLLIAIGLLWTSVVWGKSYNFPERNETKEELQLCPLGQWLRDNITCVECVDLVCPRYHYISASCTQISDAVCTKCRSKFINLGKAGYRTVWDKDIPACDRENHSLTGFWIVLGGVFGIFVISVACVCLCSAPGQPKKRTTGVRLGQQPLDTFNPMFANESRKIAL